MRRGWGILLALLLGLGIISARAEGTLTVTPSSLALGGEALVRMNAPEAVEYAYAAYKDGKPVFEGEFVPQSEGWFRPREVGEYTLVVTARDGDGQVFKAESILTVTGEPDCQLTLDKDTVAAGEAVRITLTARGGTGEYDYGCSVYLGNERIAYLTSQDASLTYAPSSPGDMRLIGEITDTQGNVAKSEPVSLNVLPGAGIGVTGETGAFPIQGGFKTWVIHTPGVWTAESDQDFILLGKTCGANGDSLTVQVLPGEDTARRGFVTVTSGGLSASFPVAQSAGSGEEEEISFAAATEYVRVNGQAWAAWQGALGEREFSVTASGNWTAACDAAFVTMSKTEGGLLVTVKENPEQSPRDARIVLSCGSQTAAIYVSQPGKAAGGDVLTLTLSADHGTAYQDAVMARAVTTLKTETLTVQWDGGREPMIFNRDHAKEENGKLVWQVDIPLSGSGRQHYLFTGHNADGAGIPALTAIQVTGEDGAIVSDAAMLRDGTLALRLTAATDSVTLLDQKNGVIGTYTQKDALIDRCVDPLGRYADWEIVLPDTVAPAFVSLAGRQVPVVSASLTSGETPFALYSQVDGWWLDKQYSKSNLQQSGCAIFALSHALQILGYTGEEILPENLAKTYAFCLREGGTVNDSLIGHAADDFGFRTRYELYTNMSEILSRMEKGAVYSFSVVSGHIAMVAEISADRTMFRIIDSAPSATFERIKGASIYVKTPSGFAPISDLSEIPGIRYYIEFGSYGGAEYWLDTSYVAKRGVRLIQPIN